MTNDSFALLKRPAWKVAPLLLGCELERTLNNKIIRLKIVETEAYDQTDAASHSYQGKTPRSDIMFGPPGYLYVYFTYGMHYCCNIVTDTEGVGSAVLLRAMEPLTNTKQLLKYRSADIANLTNGPAKLCQALNINLSLNGHYLKQSPIRLILKPPLKKDKIVISPRIGISKAKDKHWRFYIKDNTFVSKTK